jgi:adenylyltransferase/sulfurtransferase
VDSTLSSSETLRYARHLVLNEVGPDGQECLKDARVLVVGLGGLGSPAALYLAAAGVGTLGLVEFDTVDLSNLQRQVLHGTSGVGRSKLESAQERLREVNPHVSVEPYPVRLSSRNALDILRRYDVVVDGSDNFPTRYLVNDACVLLGIPYVYGSILRWEGQISLFAVPGGPCYRCLFREPPPPDLVPSCAEAGVFGALPGVVGSYQALEAIKWILGVGDPLRGRLLLLDSLSSTWREVEVRRDPDCPVCGDHPTVTELQDYEAFCGITPSEAPAEAAADDYPASVSPGQLLELLGGDDPPLLVDVRESWEWREGNLANRGARHLPLAELTAAPEALPRSRPLVFVCSVGSRSAGAAQFLRDQGHTRVANLSGGLKAWAREIQPDLTVV